MRKTTSHTEASFRVWFNENHDEEELQGIREYGVGFGLPSLFYHVDTNDLFGRFKDEILELTFDEQLTVSDLIAAQILDCPDRFKAGLIWLAIEKLATQESDWVCSNWGN